MVSESCFTAPARWTRKIEKRERERGFVLSFIKILLPLGFLIASPESSHIEIQSQDSHTDRHSTLLFPQLEFIALLSLVLVRTPLLHNSTVSFYIYAYTHLKTRHIHTYSHILHRRVLYMSVRPIDR